MSAVASTAKADTVPAAFQCAFRPVQCPKSELARLPGPPRPELFSLLTGLQGMMGNDCRQRAKAWELASQQLGWRRSESWNAASLAEHIARCFVDIDHNAEEAVHYAQRAICLDPSALVWAYSRLADAAALQADPESAGKYALCAVASIEDLDRKFGRYPGIDEVLAVQRSQAASVIWEYVREPKLSIILVEKALSFFERKREKRSEINDIDKSHVAVNLGNAIEFYVITGNTNKFLDARKRLLELATTSDSLMTIMEALEGMLYLRRGEADRAEPALASAVRRYEQLPEFVADWAWRGTRRYLEQEAKQQPSRAAMNGLLIELTRALEGPKTPAKLATLRNLWAGVRGGDRAATRSE